MILCYDGKNKGVDEDHTKCLDGPGSGPRAACCTPPIYCIDKLLSLFYETVDLKYVLISLNFEKILSFMVCATAIGIAK